MVLLSFLTTLEDIDRSVFFVINSRLHHPFLDFLLPLWREAGFWYPLYIFLLVFAILNFGKRSWAWILFFILTVSLTDQVSSGFLKDYFGRIRPCRDPQLSNSIRILASYCPQSGSFTSSHAANHFAMAFFIWYTCRNFFKNFAWLFFLWALTIGYAQIYVGVHYPFDVIGGAVVGALIAGFTGLFFNSRIGLNHHSEQIQKS